MTLPIRFSLALATALAIALAALPVQAATETGSYTTSAGEAAYIAELGTALAGDSLLPICAPENPWVLCVNVNSASTDPKHHVQPKITISAQDTTGQPVPMLVMWLSSTTGCKDPSDPTSTATNNCELTHYQEICSSASVDVPIDATWAVVAPDVIAYNWNTEAYDGTPCAGPADSYIQSATAGNPATGQSVYHVGVSAITAGTITVSGAAASPFKPASSASRHASHRSTNHLRAS